MTPQNNDHREFRIMVFFGMGLILSLPPSLLCGLLAWLADHPIYEGIGLGIILGTGVLAVMMSHPEVRQDVEAGIVEDYEEEMEKSRKKKPRPKDGYYGW